MTVAAPLPALFGTCHLNLVATQVVIFSCLGAHTFILHIIQDFPQVCRILLECRKATRANMCAQASSGQANRRPRRKAKAQGALGKVLDWHERVRGFQRRDASPSTRQATLETKGWMVFFLNGLLQRADWEGAPIQWPEPRLCPTSLQLSADPPPTLARAQFVKIAMGLRNFPNGGHKLPTQTVPNPTSIHSIPVSSPSPLPEPLASPSPLPLAPLTRS
jgi:hypothetical protein